MNFRVQGLFTFMRLFTFISCDAIHRCSHSERRGPAQLDLHVRVRVPTRIIIPLLGALPRRGAPVLIQRLDQIVVVLECHEVTLSRIGDEMGDERLHGLRERCFRHEIRPNPSETIHPNVGINGIRTGELVRSEG